MVEKRSLENEVKSCFRKRMSYVETREYLLDLGKYDYQIFIPILQKEYINHKTKFAWYSLVLGVAYITYRVFELYTERGFEDSSLRDFRHIVVGSVIVIIALISIQRAKAAARRYEEFA